MANVARWWVVLCLGGCVFDPQPQEPTGDDGSGSDPGTGSDDLARCRVDAALKPDLRLCLDFQDPFPMTVARDTSGLAHDATATGTLSEKTRTTDEIGAHLTLASLHVGATPDLDLDHLTVEMFVAISAVPLHDHSYYLLDNSGRYAVTVEDNLEIRCAFGDLRINSGAKDLPAKITQLNRWYHVACTYDGSSARVYLDGNTTDCDTKGATFASTGAGTAIGIAATSPNVADHLIGDVDNIHVFSRALTGDEICRASGTTGCRTTCPPSDGGPGPGGPGPGQ